MGFSTGYCLWGPRLSEYKYLEPGLFRRVKYLHTLYCINFYVMTLLHSDITAKRSVENGADMAGLSLNYLLRRLLVFFLTVWVAASLIFIIPRLAPGDPIGAMIARMSQTEGFIENADIIIEAWRKRFGLDDPLHVQYLRFLGNTLRLDLGYSLANFPATVTELVGRALPWTIGLVGIATFIFLTVGNLCGALLAWRKTPKCSK